MRYTAALLLLIATGCGSAKVPDMHPGGYVAGIMSLTATGAANVSPIVPDDDTPTPGGMCIRCNGTGTIKPDGRIVLTCPDCGGDGVRGGGDARQAEIADGIAALVQRLDRLEGTYDVVLERSDKLQNEIDDKQDTKPTCTQVWNDGVSVIWEYDNGTHVRESFFDFERRTGKPADGIPFGKPAAVR